MVSTRQNNPVRPHAVAGSFYPHNARLLEQTVAELLPGAGVQPDDSIRAIIAPHAGYVYSGTVAAEAFAGLDALRETIDRLVVIGPSHYVRFRGLAVPSVKAFRTPLGDMPIDGKAIEAITDLPQVVIDDEPHAPEHALEVELPFLQTVFGTIPLVPIVIGSATAPEVADVLSRLWDDRTLIVVSSDLSHYLDYETARRRDVATAKAIERLDEEAIGFDDACGSLAVRGMLIEARGRGFVVKRLHLLNSGDTAGDRHRVVGYGAWAVCKA